MISPSRPDSFIPVNPEPTSSNFQLDRQADMKSRDSGVTCMLVAIKTDRNRRFAHMLRLRSILSCMGRIFYLDICTPSTANCKSECEEFLDAISQLFMVDHAGLAYGDLCPFSRSQRAFHQLTEKDFPIDTTAVVLVKKTFHPLILSSWLIISYLVITRECALK